MEPTTATPQGPSKTEVSGMDRLEQVVSEKPVPAAVVESAIVETEKLEGAEPATTTTPTTTAATPATTTATTPATTTTEPKTEGATTEPVLPELEFKVEETPIAEEGTWASVIEDLGYKLPEGYTEEKGPEFLKQLKEQEVTQRLEEVKSYSLAAEIASFPEERRAEAKMVLDFLKTGQSLVEYNKPYEEIKEWRSLTPEAAVRRSYEKTPGYTPEMVDHQMEKLTTNPTALDLEYKIIQQQINGYESQINTHRQQQIEFNNTQQIKLGEQKRSQELSSLKAALDRTPKFMDIKLNDAVKKVLVSEAEKTDFTNLPPEDKAEFLMWKKYGQQGVKIMRDRVREELTLEQAKKQHNIPQTVTPAGGNRVSTESYKDGMDRLEKELAK